jgi:hypothetical protein
MKIEKADIDPNEPAFNIQTPSNNKINDVDVPEIPLEESGTEGKKERKPSSGKKDASDPSPRFQERFNEVYSEAKRNERELQYERERAERMEKLLEKQLTQGPRQEQGVPEKWKKILGEDNPQTEQFYQLLKEEFGNKGQSITKEEILEAIREEQKAEARVYREAEDSIDTDRDSLEDTLGRELEDDEAAEILEIAYELTPKDRYGNYEQLVPMSAAYGEYRARQLESKTPQRNARNAAASVISARGGNISDTPRPVQGGRPDPGAWRKIFGQ